MTPRAAAQDTGTVSAVVRINPLQVELRVPHDAPRVGQRFTVMARVDNGGSLPLSDVETRLLFDAAGLELQAHRTVRTDFLRADGRRIEIWSLVAREPGSYVLLASVEAMIDGEPIAMDSNAVIVDVRAR